MLLRVLAFSVLGLSSIGGLLGACAPVPAYDRGRLAHPTMKTADPAGVGESHARAIQEGSTGGGFEVGGGCGCN